MSDDWEFLAHGITPLLNVMPHIATVLGAII